MQTGHASRTAVVVCQGRAAAQGLIAPDRYRDPASMALLRPPERVAVERVRAGTPPRPWAERVEYEMVRASADVMLARTLAIDEAVRARLAPQLVILGAGLDGRAWRMGELADVDVFEVDHPESQSDKRDRAGRLAPLARSIHYVPVDFAHDRLEVALESAGHRDSTPTTWIWEGVVPYLTRAQVATTAGVVAARSAQGSRLVLNYQGRTVSAPIGRVVARGMAALARRPSPWASEPIRSTWSPGAMRSLLVSHGFAPNSDEDLLALAARLDLPRRHGGSLRAGRVAVADH